MDKKLSDYQKRLDKRLFKKISNGKVFLHVREKLCVYYDQRDFTLNLMRNISGYAVGAKMPVVINLTHCPSISAAALLIFFAEVSRAKIATENNLIITVKISERNPLKGLLNNVGWLDAVSLGFREYQSLMDSCSIFQTASEPNEAMASILRLLSKNGVELSRPETKIFTKGVNEAILNVFNHAYSHEEYPLGGIGRRWWQACWANDKKLYYIIFDLGQGILNSLPRAHESESVAEHISRAMVLGVTCTGDPKRGKGSENIKDAADIRENSTLFIGSRQALYTKKAFQKPEASECKLPFNGTLAEWQINIEEQ